MMAVPPELVGIGLAFLFVGAPFVVASAGAAGRFWSAVRRRPDRALAFFEADAAWVVLRDPTAADELGDDYDGPYVLELPDGSDRIVYGRRGAMRASMRRYLRRMP